MVDTRDDLLCDLCGVDMLRVKAITQSRNTSCDLIELNALLASICMYVRVYPKVTKQVYIPRFNTNILAKRMGCSD
jgi:hypothetical protein